MPLLPRSRRGTWLLAGAVWLTACSWLWWMLPVVPRGSMRIPEGFDLLGFGPGGTTALVQRSGSNMSDDGGMLGLIAVPSGKVVATLAEKSARHAGHSSNGRIWVFLRGLTYFKVDITELTVTALTIPPTRGDYDDPRGVTTDGRYFLFNEDTNLHQLTIWDLVHDRRHASIADIAFPDGFDARGNSVFVAESTGSPWPLSTELKLLNPEDISVIATVKAPSDLQPNVSYTGWWPPPRFAAGMVLTNYYLLRAYDGASGSLRFSLKNHCDEFDVSPEGNILVAFERFSYGTLDALLNQFGIASPFSGSAHSAVRIHAMADGSELGSILTVQNYLAPFRWLPGQQAIATMDSDYPSVWQIWDIPPRKSLPWYATGAALLALPIALVARRRVRRFRAA